MKIAHISDLHFSKERADDALKSAYEARDSIMSDPVDLIAISGDTWDASVLNTEASYFNQFIRAIQSLADLAPIVMVYGTQSHDTDGSLEVFKSVQSRFGITVLEPGKPYFLSRIDGKVNEDNIGDGSLLILGIPEPRKKYLLANGTAGKDETEEAVRNAMHQLCFQLAAIRAQYKDLPCLVVYHGDVAGTTLQNDETIERGTGIAITIDELADISADYYALGHVHKPQQVGNLPAYYAGSIYAKNFGETHKPGWNLAKLIEVRKSVNAEAFDMFNMNPDGWEAEVTRIDFSHPQNMKILAGFQDKGIPTEGLKGYRVWVEISCKKEEQALVDADKVLSQIMKAGAAIGSKVTVSVQAVETVRAAEIAEASTPEKKLEVWGENSAIEITAGMKARLAVLQDNAARSVVSASGSWELVSARIRGFIGIKKGIKRDEIFVDFDSFDDGLIALIGSNGKGKTTFFENCHPYSRLLTRKGKLQDHCFLRDSFREVIYRNPATGAEKRFLIQIDGANKSGTVKGYVFDRANSSADWQPLPGVDGNMKDYDKAVEDFCGPIELFLRTAFTTQKSSKNFPDLTEATEGEKKALFTNLAGIDYLQVFADGAKAEGDKLAAASHDAEVKIGVLEGAVAGRNEISCALQAYELNISTLSDNLETCKTSGTAAKNRVETLQVAANTERSRAQRAADAELALGNLRHEMDDINRSIADYEVLSGMRPEYEAEIARYESLKTTIETETEKLRAVEKRNQGKTDDYRALIDAFNAKKAEIEKKIDAAKDELREKERALEAKNQAKMADYQKAVEAFNERKRSLESQVSQARIALQKAQADAESMAREISFAESSAPEINDTCPTCKQRLPSEKITELTQRRYEALQRIDTMQVALSDQNSAIAQAEARLNELEADLGGIDADRPTAPSNIAVTPGDLTLKAIEDLELELAGIGYGEPTKPALETFDDSILSSARTQACAIQIDELRADLTRATEATARIEGYKAQIRDKNRLIVEKQGELDELVRNANPDAIADLELAKTELNNLIEQHRKLTADLATNQAQLEAQRKRLAEIEAQEAELAKLRESIVTAKGESAEWDLLRRAFGPDGIQALELDALAPGIAEIANRILSSAYGDRFRVEFQTTRIAGTGKNTKQIEDFLIFVIDSQDGESVLLENKSGGEAVWVKRAIYDAFAVIRARNTNFRFLTCFQDETDGALDPEAKQAYCRMLEAAHDEGGLRHTIIITHSDEVKAMISQKIEMEAFAEEKADAGKTEEAEFALEAAV